MGMRSKLVAVSVAMVAMPGAAASASAATVKLDKACYVNHDEPFLAKAQKNKYLRYEVKHPLWEYSHNAKMVVTGSGYPANSKVTLTASVHAPGSANDDVVTGTTDATGAFRIEMRNPDFGFDIPGPNDTHFKVTAHVGHTTTTTHGLYAQGQMILTADRVHGKLEPEYIFVGLRAGSPIWGHFLLPGGKLKGSERYGVAKGPCGILDVTVRYTWPFYGEYPKRFTVQYDNSKHYSTHARPRIVRHYTG